MSEHRELMREQLSPEEYASYLAFGDEDTGEAPVPPEFIKDDDDQVWFVSGGNKCVGCEFCNWHNGMDAVYAVGSSTVANVGVPVEVLKDAITLLEACDPDNEYDRAERDHLIVLSKAAVLAEPSKEVQYAYDIEITKYDELTDGED